MGKRVEKTAIATKHDERLNFSQTHNHLTCLKAVAAFVLLRRAEFFWGGDEIQLESQKKNMFKTKCFTENRHLKRKML